MEKKFYFVDVDDCDVYYLGIDKEEFKKRAKFVLTVEELVDAFNSGNAPSQDGYYCRYL